MSAAAASPDTSGRSAALVALSAGLLFLLALILAAGIGARELSPLISILAVVLGIGGLLGAVLRPRWVFLAFVTTCMVIPFVLEEISLPLGFMKLYIQDVVFAWNVLVCLVRWSLHKLTYKSLPFNRYLVLHFLLGVWSLGVGFLVSNNPFDSVFGDFRRSYFYFMNYFIAIFLVDGLPDARLLRSALLLGAGGAILKGLYQIAAGQFVYRRIGDAAHVLTHFEITFLMFLIYYGLTQVVFRPDRQRLYWLLPVALGVIVVAIGNFRACWLALIGGLTFMFFFLPQRQRWMMMIVAAMGAAFLALAIATMWDVEVSEGHSTIGEEILAKADVKNTTGDINVVWRFESYANALLQWRRSPIIGTGLGEVLEFSATTSTGGAMLAQGHRVHNSFIWLLMSLGVTGFALFAFIQSRYVLAVLRYIKTSEWLEGRSTALACLTFYISIMIAAAFEIFLESAMPITVLSSSMALAMLMIYYTPKKQDQSSPALAAGPAAPPASQP